MCSSVQRWFELEGTKDQPVDGQTEHLKPGFIMLLFEATEVLPVFFMGINAGCADNIKVCKA